MHSTGKQMSGDTRKKSQNKRNRRGATGRRPHASSMDYGDQIQLAAKGGRQAVLHLSEGASNFAEVLHHPWDSFGIPAKMPILPILPTATYTNFNQKVEVTSNSAGHFYILFQPAGALAVDTSCGYHSSGGTWTPGTAIPVYSGTNQTPFYVAGSPFGATDYGTGVNSIRSRILGFGARLFYDGTELNRGGSVQFLASPNKQSVIGASADDLATYRQTRIDSLSSLGRDGLIGQVTRPILVEEDMQFLRHNGSSWIVAGLSTGVATLDNEYWIAITGTIAPNTPLRLEVTCCFEAYGRPTATSATRGNADRTGMEAVIGSHAASSHSAAPPSAGPNRPSSKAKDRSTKNRLLAKLAKEGPRFLSFVADKGLKTAASAVASALF